MPKLMQILENTFNVTVRGNSSSEINYNLTTTNAVAQVVRKRFASNLGDIKIPDYTGIKGKDWSKVSDFAVIPRQKNARSEGNYTYVILLYRNVENGLPNNRTTNKNGEDWKVSSFVMSCFFMLDGEPVEEVSPPAILNFGVSANESYEKECCFWDVHQSLWSKDGVQEVKLVSSPTRTVCQTYHFTSFAVLIQHKKQPLSPANKLALSIITYIGCGVSTAALIITLVILLSLETLSSERHKIHMNLVFSLLLAQILFLAGIQETSSPTICKIIAAFLHYFFLTAFTWMLVEGFHLYLKVVQVFNIENVKILYYYTFGWGFSIIPVVITVAVRPNSYGNREICWLSIEDGTVWAFIGPVIGIIAMNCFVLFMVIKTVVSSASAMKNSEHAHIKAGIKGLFVLMPILGVGWILGLFALNESTIVFEYAFAIVNGFQGLLIFLLHCAFNNEVRQAFRRQREKNALSKENDSQYHASFSLSKTEDSGSKKLSSSNSFKASASFKNKKTTKFVQVQPVSESQDISENSIRVKRTFQGKSPGNLAVTDTGNEISSLNCPIMEDEVRPPPKISQLRSQRTTSTRKHSRH